MLTQDLVLAGLKKVGPCSPGTLADHLHVEAAALGYHLKKMLDAGSIKAAGKSNARRLALPEQKLDEAESPTPPQRKKRKPKSGRKAKQHRKTHRSAASAQPAAERFIPTVDASSRLVIVNGGEPLIFDEAQTEAIASLLLIHYKA